MTMKTFQPSLSKAPLPATAPSPASGMEQLLTMLCQEERMRGLVRHYFSDADLLAVRKRLIGSGAIGGKATGMLLARAILQADADSTWKGLLEPHDSFYVGSDLFALFMDHNGWQELLQEQQSAAGYLTAAEKLRDLIPSGEFPPGIRGEFSKMLEYYGQYPIIARSSSLMEDGFGNAFAGKYDSFFCVNQGVMQERLRHFENAVRKIYLSMMSEEALQYRLRRGLAGGREEMAILVQRVSGRRHGNYFLPALAGVGVSYNTFVWNSAIDPKAGMLRLVVGLGTRAVDRVEGDYPRIVSLDQPLLSAIGDHEDLRRYSQRDIDLLDIAANSIRTISLREFFSQENRLPVNLIGHRDGSGWLVTFDKLFTRTDFADTMRKLLAVIEKAYGYPVDVEFTVNFIDEDLFRLNIVQCRPLQTRGVQSTEVQIAPAADDDTLFRSRGSFMGGSVMLPLRRIVWVDPEKYSALLLSDKYELARIIGRINRLMPSRDTLPTLLMGPGRWGTTTPSLGVPVRFAEFNAMAAIAEVAFSAGGLMPELSFGSHFFQDLVESGIFYVALHPDRKECFLNDRLLSSLPNLLAEILPDDARFADLLRVVDLPAGFALQADIVSQELACSLLAEEELTGRGRALEAPAVAMTDGDHVTTGLAALDRILGGLRLGDNVVWRLDNVAEFTPFVTPFVRSALSAGRRVVYIRFAGHEPLLPVEAGITVHNLDALRGFESFTVRLHAIIAAEGRETFYVFDCLSSLLDAWATDTMIGNFFAITCPFLYELGTVAYFPLLRDIHPFPTVARIRATTQLLLDLHAMGSETIIHPLKVWRRFSPTMFLPHRLRGESFEPIVASCDASSLFMDIHGRRQEKPTPHIDHWEWLFLRAAKLARGKGSEKSRQAMVENLGRLLFGSDVRMLNLARRYMNLEDFLRIKERMIGTGYLGGKAAGMLIARAILEKDDGYDWNSLLEPHDSYFVGSDLFHTYIVHNGWWRVFMEHKQPEGYFEGAAKLRKLLLLGSFPAGICEQFQKLLEYFGQYPIIVRLSSLQEDGFGNAFAGKYGSFFCVNQGSPEERYCQFEDAVRLAYASTMSEDALRYRLNRGLDRQEEQLALLVQRVSGAYHGKYFFPEISGVGLSYNTYVWEESVDPHAGMLRLVFGLGTRATGRVAGDYPRIVSLDQPTVVPFSTLDNGSGTIQRQIDLLDIAENECRTMSVAELLSEQIPLPENYGAFRNSVPRRGGVGVEKVLSFDRLLAAGEFPAVMGTLLATLEQAYNYPVDLEFTATSSYSGSLRLNLLQCRPLQTRGVQVQQVEIPQDLPRADSYFSAQGHFLGGSILQPINRILHVSSGGYLALPVSDRYELARIIGRLNRLIPSREEQPTLLVVPGRLGTTTPEMGIPVRFAEIDAMTALAEVSFSAGSLMPELSFGSHFFQDLVESEIFYTALYPEETGCHINRGFLAARPNILAELLPDSARFSDVLTVVDVRETLLMADIVSQQVCCCRQKRTNSEHTLMAADGQSSAP
jgi:hypothetical protein